MWYFNAVEVTTGVPNSADPCFSRTCLFLIRKSGAGRSWGSGSWMKRFYVHRPNVCGWSDIVNQTSRNGPTQSLLTSDSVFGQLHLRLCLCPVPDCQPTATELSRSPPLGSGTVFLSTSHLRRHFPPSAFVSRQTIIIVVIHRYFCSYLRSDFVIMDT